MKEAKEPAYGLKREKNKKRGLSKRWREIVQCWQAKWSISIDL